MSRLLSRLQERLRVAPSLGLGLALGRTEVTAAHCAKTAGGWELRSGETATLSGRLFDGNPGPDVAGELTAVLERLCAPARKTTIPVQIVLPDPALSLQTFVFDKLPKAESEQMKLVSWRFAKQLETEVNLIRCAFQVLPARDGKSMVLASAIKRPWLELVLQACRDAGVSPAVVDAGMSFHFNQLQDRLTSGADGVLLVVQPDQWAILLCDGDHLPQYIRARWWEGAQISAREAAVAEIERLIRTYAHGASGRSIGTVAVTGTEPELSSLATLLDRRMRAPCLRAPIGTLFCAKGEGANDAVNVSSAACVAGLPR